MNTKNTLVTVGLLAVLSLVGCNVGEAPSGSPQAVQDQFKSMKPEDQIKFIQDSPMPPADKAAKIEEIKKQAGITGETPAPTGPPQHG